jgi:hypothetical protein
MVAVMVLVPFMIVWNSWKWYILETDIDGDR